MSNEITRAAACHKVADCFDPSDLLRFFSHPNRHPRKAALHKIILLHRGVVTREIKNPEKLIACLRSWDGFKTKKEDELRDFLKANGKAEVANLLFLETST